MVTNAEYQKASKSLNEQYTADSLQNYQTAYNDYKAQGMSTTDAVNKAKGLLVANEQKTPRDTGDTGGVKETIVDENINDETIKQETPIEQGENIGSTGGEIKQEGELKPLSQEYYNQKSDEAQDTIRYNLNGYRQSNPELFSDYETFKKNFSYDARDDVQKNTLDNWYKGYEKGLQLSTIPVNELYTQYKDGSISLSDLENLRISNPSKYNELQEQINKGNIISAYDDDKGTTEDSLQDMAYNAAMQMFTKWMSGESSSGASQIFADYEAKMNNPEMLELSDNCTEVQEQMENIQADIDSMKKQVEAEFAGKGASRSKINAIIADRTYDLQLQLRTLNSEYSKYATQYNNRMQQYQNEFGMQLQEYQINQTERQNQMKELGFALDLMNFETNEQKAQREWDYWVKQQEYQNGNINSKDYQTRYKAALTSVQNLLSQYEGIPMERSAEQMAQDVLKAIEGGSDLGTELTKINKLIQQKPEYKQVYNQTFGTSSQGFGKTVKIGDTDYVEYNGQLYTAEDFNKKFGNAISVSPEVMSQGLETFKTRMQSLVATGGAIRKGWCGEPVNDYLKSIGSNVQYDNDLQTKLDSITPGAGPKVGSIAIWDGSSFNSPDAKKHGHVAIVTGIDEKNGTITVLESNGQAHSMGMGYGTYNMANVTGYFDPTAGYSASSSNSSDIKRDYNTTRVGLYDKYINEGTAPTDAKLKALGGGDLDKGWQIFDAEVQDYMDKTGAGTLEKRTNDELTKLRTQFNQEQTVKDYKDMQTNYSKIEIAASKGTPQGDMSLIFAYMKMLDPGSVVREGEYATAQNAGNVGDKIINLYNKVITGKKLTESQRKEFLETAKSLMDGMTVNYNNLLDDYASYISWGGDVNKIGKKGTFLTDEFNAKYGTSTASSGKGKKWGMNTINSTVNSGSGIQSTNFYQTYANTAPSNNKKYVVNGVEIDR